MEVGCNMKGLDGIRGSWMDLKNTNAQRIYEKRLYTQEKLEQKKAHTQNSIHDKKGGPEGTTKRGAVTRTQRRMHEAE